MDDSFRPILFHMIRVSNHVSIEAGVNWYPWANKPSRVALGWEAEPHDGSATLFCYLMPDLWSKTPRVHVHIGTTGDPEIDPIVAALEVAI
jgi:hypothetical protein